MYSASTNQVKKSISRFHQSAYSGCFRQDGQLLAAGSEEGVVKVWIFECGVHGAEMICVIRCLISAVVQY